MDDMGEERGQTLGQEEEKLDYEKAGRKSKLGIVYTNARSVNKKMHELKVLASDLSPEIIVLTETWTNLSITNEYLQIPGYTIVARSDRNDTNAGRGGGILVWTKSNMIAFQKANSLGFNQLCEVQVEVRQGNPLSIYAIYRSPNSVEANDEKLINFLSTVRHPSIIVGDFNFPGISWETSTSNSEGQSFLEAVQENFLIQHIDFPTQKSGNILDLVLTTSENMMLGARDEGKLGNSDHSIIRIEIQMEVSNKTEQKILNFAKADFEKMRENLSKVNWSRYLSNEKTEDNWLGFKKVLEAEVKNIPLKRRRNKDKPVWMNDNLLRLVRQKRCLWKRYKESKHQGDFNKYKELEKKVVKSIRRAKHGFEKKLAQNAKKDPKAFYSYLKSKKSNRETVGPILSDSGELVTDCQQQANILNAYFASVFTEEDMNNLPRLELRGVPEMSEVTITEQKVLEKIQELKKDSAPGPDGIQTRILKEVAEEISLPLAKIFKHSLDSGQVPADWRCANVTPIFKKGAKSNPGNYRPISLTSVVCKIMEKLMKDAIMQHVMTNELLRQTQHGFVTKKSCVSNLLQFYEEVTKLVDEGTPVDIVYLDFAKAFDVVPHERLLIKLKAIGIHEKVLQWTRAWLKQRKQRVVLNGKASSWESVTSSVVQGSVLGPDLFVIYIDDIDECVNIVKSFLNKFADDTKVAKAIHGLEDNEELQAELDNLWSWACKWQMKFNVDKCKIMHTGRTNPKLPYTLNGTTLSITTEEKDLGVIITDNLKPSQQCAAAARKGNQILGQIRRGFTCYDKETIVAIYKQYVRPHLEYAIQAWCPWTQKDIKVLEAVQKRAIRLINGLKGTYEEKLQQINLTTLEERRIRGDAIETFKILKGFTQIRPDTWFELAAIQEGPQTRHLTSFLPLKRQTGNLEIRRKWFSGRATRGWNALPDYVREAKTVNEFKNLYDLNQIKLHI